MRLVWPSWKSQAKTEGRTTTVRGVVKMVCVWGYQSLVRVESDRAVLAQILPEPELKVAKERMALLGCYWGR